MSFEVLFLSSVFFLSAFQIHLLFFFSLEEFAQDNVRYLELRTTLRPKSKSGFDKEEYLLVVLEEIDKAVLANPGITVRLIASIDRQGTLSDALDTVQLANKHRHRGIVGIDLCGDPSVGKLNLPFSLLSDDEPAFFSFFPHAEGSMERVRSCFCEGQGFRL